jgi:DNA invertase Pin-like site-specific DNA recombinase
MNVFPYIRVSGKSQVDGDGPERQLEKIYAFCRQNRMPEGGPTQDLGVSGTVEGFDRPGLASIFQFAKPGDTIVVENMDRLARDLMVQEIILESCRKKGIAVFSADNGPVDMAMADGVDPMRKLVRQIMGAIAEYNKSQLVARMKSARDKKRQETGRCGGVLPYGQLPGEADILEYMLQTMRVAGMTHAHLAGSLNLSGYRTREGKEWNKKRVWHVLKGTKLNERQPSIQ